MRLRRSRARVPSSWDTRIPTVFHTGNGTGIVTGMATTKTNVTIALDTPLAARLRAAAGEDGASVTGYVEKLVRAELARRAVRTLNAARPVPEDLREAADDDWERRVA